MPALPFVDANIFLRHLTQDHPDHSPRATAFLSRIEAGEVRARTADTVIFETVFTLEKQYREPRSRIRAVLLPLVMLPGMVLRNKRRMRRAFAHYVRTPALSFADSYHVALMESLKLREIVSFDRGLDRVPTITRKEPDVHGLL